MPNPFCKYCKGDIPVVTPIWSASSLVRVLPISRDGTPASGTKLGGAPQKSAQFWAKNGHFSPEQAQNGLTRSKRIARAATDMVCSSTIVFVCPLIPRYVQETPPKRPKICTAWLQRTKNGPGGLGIGFRLKQPEMRPSLALGVLAAKVHRIGVILGIFVPFFRHIVELTASKMLFAMSKPVAARSICYPFSFAWLI